MSVTYLDGAGAEYLTKKICDLIPHQEYVVVGTRAEIDAKKAAKTIPNGALVVITDDYTFGADAIQIYYDNNTSQLVNDNLQYAIDEIVSKINAILTTLGEVKSIQIVDAKPATTDPNTLYLSKS